MFKCKTPEVFRQCMTRHLKPNCVLEAFKLQSTIIKQLNSSQICVSVISSTFFVKYNFLVVHYFSFKMLHT